MSREKQSGDCKNCNSHVEKMAKDAGCPSRLPCEECLLYNECDRLVFAESLYNADYRKQSEVIAEFSEAVKHIAEGVKFKNSTEKTAFIEMLEDLASVKMKGGAE